jgi:two-component system, NarL family, nitrate/nitrite response regulator NarL
MAEDAEKQHPRVLIVDDHDLFRTGLRALLEEEGFEVADSRSAESAIRRVGAFAPDVVLMDMNMPTMSGVEATPLVLEAAPATAVLMLTIASDETPVLAAVRAGACGYLLKSAELSEIASAIRAAAAGLAAVAPGVAGFLLDSIRSAGEPEAPNRTGPDIDLSSRERAVLTLLSEGRDNAEIARRLSVSPSTVKHHVSKVMSKIGVDNRVQAAVFAIRSGIADDGEVSATRGDLRRAVGNARGAS